MSDELDLAEISARVRTAIDNALEEQTYTQRWEGHVNLVDGDVDTADLAQVALEAAFVYISEWVAARSDELVEAFACVPGFSEAWAAPAVQGGEPQ